MAIFLGEKLNDLVSALKDDESFFEPIDRHFAMFLQGLDRDNSGGLAMAAALVSRATRQGHICIDLHRFSGRPLVPGSGSNSGCPHIDSWVEQLKKSRAVGAPGEYKPLILDEKARLYLYKYWEYENRCAQILTRMSSQEIDIDQTILKSGLSRLFPIKTSVEIDRQKIAAVVSVTRGLSIITGGPGTGKTSVVSKILALIIEQNPGVHIALSAPTGKASQRLFEAVRTSVVSIDCKEDIKATIPVEGLTIHRLLGMKAGSRSPRYNARNPLPHDVIIIDEASMVDLALMARLLAAIKPGARLILLGDKDQLASVEAGYVLGDICDTGGIHKYSRGFVEMIRDVVGYDMEGGAQKGMQDSIVELTKTYRFGPDSGIRRLSESVNRQDIKRCEDILLSGSFKDISLIDISVPTDISGYMSERIISGYEAYLLADTPQERFRLFSRFRVLCALRQGPFGVVRINSLIETILADRSLIRPSGQYYKGKPIIISKNDYNMRLFNGDIGIILKDPKDNDLKAFFPGQGDSVRKIPVGRLPGHECAYAMTVHKSQGSEFEHVLMILPDRDSPVLTRELIYTGITRAGKCMDLCVDMHIFNASISRGTCRTSGLNALLWEK